ncbi:hypothetical protein [Streptomyces sp. Z26]|uniref:hypothetical protein n=1 Tax=Streptomyces sp. Z26 TaxID=2500177 RepID=UPI000EF17358|nr:hypothetical protein [Streptomyces sp. Z26]RLL69425.1 hypothetical protein D7M15_24230 [Streptomyces sp. Z26]
MGLITSLSIEEFLSLPFPVPSVGGYAGLVFLISRTADAPELQKRFFREWADIHDVTARHVGVVIPSPWEELRLGRLARWGSGSVQVRVRGVRRIVGRDGPNPSSSWYPDGLRPEGEWQTHVHVHTAAVDFLPRRPVDHQSDLTRTVSDMQEFFGISEALLPCAVVVCLSEQQAVAVALENDDSVYGLLKQTKSQAEDHLAELRRYDADIAAAEDELRIARVPLDVNIAEACRAATAAERGADVALRAWHDERDEAVDVLARFGGTRTDHDGQLCRRVSEVLASGMPLTGNVQEAVQEVMRLFDSPNVAFLRLPSKIPRIQELREEYLEKRQAHREANRRLDAAENAARHALTPFESWIESLKVERNNAVNGPWLAAAVAAASQSLGLQPAGAHGLLSWRRLTWPVTVWKRPEQNLPIFSRARS